MRIVQLLAHEIEEADQLRLLTSLGYEVFSPGAYENPSSGGGNLRPSLDVPYYQDLARACWEKRHAHRDDGTTVDGREIVDWAKYELPDAVLDWADVILVHHFEHTWIVPQWPRLKASGKRIVWRTVGQSVENNERAMAPLVADGLEVVRYSPKERNIPGFAGETALIRFYKDPSEWSGWVGDSPMVINITQHLYQRSLENDGKPKALGQQWTNWSFWDAATKGLPGIAMGPGSEAINGTGKLSLDQMHEMLRRARAYLYCGTQPACYTLALIEALMTGVPVVSIGPSWFQQHPYGPRLFEGHEIARFPGPTPADANKELRKLLCDEGYRREASEAGRARAIELFGMETVGRDWKAFLG